MCYSASVMLPWPSSFATRYCFSDITQNDKLSCVSLVRAPSTIKTPAQTGVFLYSTREVGLIVHATHQVSRVAKACALMRLVRQISLVGVSNWEMLPLPP